MEANLLYNFCVLLLCYAIIGGGIPIPRLRHCFLIIIISCKLPLVVTKIVWRWAVNSMRQRRKINQIKNKIIDEKLMHKYSGL